MSPRSREVWKAIGLTLFYYVLILLLQFLWKQSGFIYESF
jgi:hypothetical protein